MFSNALSASHCVNLIDLDLVISGITKYIEQAWTEAQVKLHLLHPFILVVNHSQIFFGFAYPARISTAVISSRSEISGLAIRMIPEGISKTLLKLRCMTLLLLLCCLCPLIFSWREVVRLI